MPAIVRTTYFSMHPSRYSHFSIATWNLDRPTHNRRARRQGRIDKIVDQQVDLWVLTETDRKLKLDGFDSAATLPSGLSGYGDEEAFAAIHYSARFAPEVWPCVFDNRFAVCLRFPESPIGPLIVYGSIITYHMDGVAEGARVWQRHQESTRKHGENWQRLKREYPDHLLVVAGDFNQVLDGGGRYWNARSIDALNAAFAKAGLKCLTRENFRDTQQLSRHSVDHIAISESNLTGWSVEVRAWEGATKDGSKLSDHNGVTVTLSRGIGPR